MIAKTQFQVGRNKISNTRIKLQKHNICPAVTYLATEIIKDSERHIKTSKYF